ncbi:MAG: ABC transporter substrate-binding protein, partial [Nocardioidaceae bacterium]
MPDPPYVIPHKWLTPGTYGGSLHTVTPATDDASTGEYMYGHSVLRWLNDGLDVGPGLAYSWEANDDTSEWTFHFRKGLKWSDGKSWTTADILFWWEDLVLNDDYPASVPDEMRSGKGTLAKVSAPDAVTLVMSFDAPTPLTADRVADWANGTHLNGPIWMAPKHYLARFHPAYNKSAPKDWAAADGPIVLKGDYARNPGCPTMTAWRLASYDEGKSLVWERNPYCYCVDRDGKQLPYIDDLTMTSVQDPEVAQLQVQQGKVDFAFGRFIGLELGDVSELKRTSSRSDLDI